MTLRRKKEPRVIPNVVPRFFFPAEVWRAWDTARDLLFTSSQNRGPASARGKEPSQIAVTCNLKLV
jgi:hypothetical protein